MIKALSYIFIALAGVGVLTHHLGAAMLALLWVGVCVWGERALAKAPLVIGDGVIERQCSRPMPLETLQAEGD